VQGVECRVEAAVEPHTRHGEEHARDRHGEQTREGEEVAAAFDRQRAGVAEASPQEDEHAREHEHRGDVERVEHEPADDALGVEVDCTDSRHVHLVPVGPRADALEVQQAKRQGDRDERGKHAPQNTN
jgi:hypothetical protein